LKCAFTKGNDSNNCGACGTICPEGQECQKGTCKNTPKLEGTWLKVTSMHISTDPADFKGSFDTHCSLASVLKITIKNVGLTALGSGDTAIYSIKCSQDGKCATSTGTASVVVPALAPGEEHMAVKAVGLRCPYSSGGKPQVETSGYFVATGTCTTSNSKVFTCEPSQSDDNCDTVIKAAQGTGKYCPQDPPLPTKATCGAL